MRDWRSLDGDAGAQDIMAPVLGIGAELTALTLAALEHMGCRTILGADTPDGDDLRA